MHTAVSANSLALTVDKNLSDQQQFYTRINKCKLSFQSNCNNSTFAQHLFDNGHATGQQTALYKLYMRLIVEITWIVMRNNTYIRKPKKEIRLKIKITNIDRIGKYQTPQMVSPYLHSTLHDITEGSSISICSTHAFLFLMPYRWHP